MASVDIVRHTATELQEFMKGGELTSVELVQKTLAQIDLHNQKGLRLKAVISVAPEDHVLDEAAKLDAERAAGKLRGPLHGIPVLLKDVILTHSDLGMPTTVGSFSLMNAKANRSAIIVDKLIERGLIIVAKTNLNELSSWKAMGPMNGWSAVGGQTTSAYVGGQFDFNDGVMGHTNPCGASTGSAVGVSAGFSPVALGTEVDGSLVQPSARAALNALKPTIGATELQGIFAVSDDFDSLGTMAKSTRDLALMVEIVLNQRARATIPDDGYISFLQKDFSGLRVGFADPSVWRWPQAVQPQHQDSGEQLDKGYAKMVEEVEANGGQVVFPVQLPPASAYMLDGQPATIVAIRHVFKKHVDQYLSLLDSSDMKTIEDIARYNAQHADKELPPDFPEQGRLLDTLENPISKETFDKALKHCREVGREESIDKAMRDHHFDLIAFPMDSPCPRVAAAAGYPIATVPVGVLNYNGRPFGLGIVAKAGREDLLFKFMSAHESVSGPRPVPSSLRQ